MGMAFFPPSPTVHTHSAQRVNIRHRNIVGLAVAAAATVPASFHHAPRMGMHAAAAAPPPKNTPKGPQSYRKFGTVKQLGRKQRGSIGLYLLSLVCLVLICFGLMGVGKALRTAFHPGAVPNTSMAQLEKDQAQLQKELDLLGERVNLLQRLLEAKGVISPKE